MCSTVKFQRQGYARILEFARISLGESSRENEGTEFMPKYVILFATVPVLGHSGQLLRVYTLLGQSIQHAHVTVVFTGLYVWVIRCLAVNLIVLIPCTSDRYRLDICKTVLSRVPR